MFGAKKRIKKQFVKDFGVEVSNEECDKIINWTRSGKFEHIDDFIQQKITERDKK